MNLNPNKELRIIAHQYNATRGLAPLVEGHYVPVNKAEAAEIAKAYDALPAYDHSIRVANAYRLLAIEVRRQWDFLESRGYYMQPWTWRGQPYNNSREMCQDVREHKHLYYFTGGEFHPFLGQIDPETGASATEMFRAVHDLFGHAAEGYQFGPRGEENAWIHHSQMFTPLAQLALSSETRGQNSWVNFGQFAHLAPADRPYADQKVALLPVHMCDWHVALTSGRKVA